MEERDPNSAPAYSDSYDGFNYQQLRRIFFSVQHNNMTPSCLYKKEYDKQISQILANNWRNKYYDVHFENGTQYLIKRQYKNEPLVKYMAIEDQLEAIVKTHLDGQHADLYLMHKLIKQNYPGVVIFDRYLELVVTNCNVCVLKSTSTQSTSTGDSKISTMVIQPKSYQDHLYQKNNEIVHISIQDMTATPDGKFNYLLIYKDDYSSFMILRPLMKKDSLEIASEIAQIFFSFGPCKVLLVPPLEFDLYVSMLKELQQLYKACDVTLEKSLPLSTWAGRIKNEVLHWMARTCKPNWGIGCHIVQLELNQKNNILTKYKSSFHRMFKGNSTDISDVRRTDSTVDETTKSMVDETTNSSVEETMDADCEVSENPRKRPEGTSKPVRMSEDASKKVTEETNVDLDREASQTPRKRLKKTHEAIQRSVHGDISSTVIQSDKNMKNENPTTDIDNKNMRSNENGVVSGESKLKSKENKPKSNENGVATNANALEESNENGQNDNSDPFERLIKESYSTNTPAPSQEPGPSSTENRCSVCSTVMYKYFQCSSCLKPVHLYCALRSAGAMSAVCVTCASKTRSADDEVKFLNHNTIGTNVAAPVSTATEFPDMPKGKLGKYYVAKSHSTN